MVVLIHGQVNTPKERFRAKEFKRLFALCCRYRTPLVIGLLSTVVFACLHTLSIGAAFPVFKILLEKEGLQGWVDRTLAGERLGASLAPATEEGRSRLIQLDSDSDLYRQGLREGDHIQDAHQRPVAELLHELAHNDALTTVVVQADVSNSDSRAGQHDLRVTPRELPVTMRLLRWCASKMPSDADEDRLRTLTYILIGLVTVVVLANVFRYIGEVWIAKAVLLAMMHLRTDLYERTLQLPMSFFAQRKTSDLVGRFVQDMQEVQRGMLTLLGKFIREPLRAVLVLGLAFMLDWRLTLALILVAPIAILLFWRVGRRVKRSNRKLLAAYGEMIGALTTSLQNLRVVKAYTAEGRERERLKQVDFQVLRQQLKLARLQAFVSPAMETVAIFASSILVLWLANQVLNRELELSKFATLGVALTVLFDPLRRLSEVYVRVQRSTAGAERIFQVLDTEIESDGFPSQTELKPLQKGIEYVNVSFTYPGASAPALKDVNLSIRRGETVAIVGPNGSGKTTLVSMLLRLFNPDTGEIRYDGIDIRDATLKSLRHRISLVTQEPVVFGGTPVENIAYGSDFGGSADEERVRNAARRASADEFIRAIPGGYDATLGERGTTLSGGQRQRLAIARAIFRDAPILIFDEATSQVDSESELKIHNALQEFAKGRTTIIIAHRLSTIHVADRIIVMDDGRVIDIGTHKELFGRCPVYQNLCETQFVTEPASA